MDFLLIPNSRSIVVADSSENAIELLDRVKFYVRSYEETTGFTIPLRYNSRYELVNAATNAKYTIGTAKDAQFGRSKTITNLHLSEAAFYPDMEKLLAGALQAVVPSGKVIIETTANGINYFSDFWERSQLSPDAPEHTGFTPLFYKASDFYSPEFLAQKRKELGRLFVQEYPESPEEAFLTSGDAFFDLTALKRHEANVKEELKTDRIWL